MSDVTRILSEMASGDDAAAEKLLPLVYDELRKLAAGRLRDERPGQTLQATALVHEAYVRLADGAALTGWDSRGHFFAAAAEAMRRILVEAARRKKRIRHGGERGREELHDTDLIAPEPREDLIALDQALDELASVDPDAARLVQLRYFAGLSIPDAARTMSISPRTADRLWAYARAWLHEKLKRNLALE